MEKENRKQKRKCVFNDKLKKEFPKFKLFKPNSQSDLQCNICSGQFSIQGGGRYDITKHISSEKHKKFLDIASSSSKVPDYFRNYQFNDQEKYLAAKEGTFAYHNIMHCQSFRSMDCASKIIKKLFEKKFALDTSNHKDIKLFPILVRYFHFEKGIQIKLLKMLSVTQETAEVLSNEIIRCLNEENITEKLIGISADNTNTNFGGKERKGQNNIYKKISNHVGGKNIFGAGCCCHILSNTIQTAADTLPVSIELIIIKIYSHFHIYTVRCSKLAEICDNADIEYKKILGHARTRWLSLLPSVERLLKLYKALKQYFLQEIDNCPLILKEFFNNPLSEVWLLFIHSEAAIFHNAILKIERSTATIMEIYNVISDVIDNYKYRLQESFKPLSIKAQLAQLTKSDNLLFKKHLEIFYTACINYLSSWTGHLNEAKYFSWLLLKTKIEWNSVQETIEMIRKTYSFITIDDNNLIDEIRRVNIYVSDKKLKNWYDINKAVDQRWTEIFQHFNEQHIDIKDLKILVEFGLCLLGTNACVEQVFSLINQIWTPEKTQLLVKTMEAIISVKFNFKLTCEEFSDFLLKNPKIIKKIHSTEKYNFKM